MNSRGSGVAPIILLSLAIVGAVLMAGCGGAGGHAPTFPSPDAEEAADGVEGDSHGIEAGETPRVTDDTAVRVADQVRTDG